jgi:RHS repeat-associated protein
MGCIKLDILGKNRRPLQVVHSVKSNPKNRLLNYYPFGLEWEAPTTQVPKYRNAYNDKERISHTKYLDFGARDYIKTANIFMGPDPISSQFPHVTTINYAENGPVTNVDLHGLQKVRFSSKAANNSTFMASYQVNRQTSGGAKFQQALKSQSKIDVFYTTKEMASSGLTSGPFGSFKEFEAENKEFNLKDATRDVLNEVENAFEIGKELLIIGVQCIDNCSTEQLREGAFSLNHEEVAHGINILQGRAKTQEVEHQDYQNSRDYTSPNTSDIKQKSKFRNTPAKKQLDEIDKILKNGY